MMLRGLLLKFLDRLVRSGGGSRRKESKVLKKEKGEKMDKLFFPLIPSS